jgi:hemerythrin
VSVLQWRSEFGLGNETIDHDHQELIGRIKERQLKLEGCEDPRKIVRVLGEIYADIADHFTLEERLMEQMRYAAYADHKEDHETLLEELREIMVNVEADGVLDEAELTDDLDRWFSDHFRTHDAKLHKANE